MADELRQLVKARRQELRLSYTSLAAACVDGESGASVSVGWLHRLETGEPVIAPSVEVLAALSVGLRLDLVRLQEAASAQFFGLSLPPEASGEQAEILRALALLPERQRRALADLVRVMARDC
jgi:transcriptional regulator with XRE-family HTH domain